MTSEAMKYELLPGRNIVVVTGNGKSNADEIEEGNFIYNSNKKSKMGINLIK